VLKPNKISLLLALLRKDNIRPDIFSIIMDTKPCHKTLAQQIVKALNLGFVQGMDAADSENL
jgi:hypothetical protein